MTISPVGFGCDPLGGHNWGTVDPDAIMRAIPLALDLGVTFFDTADCYGAGASEERLGIALGARRNEALIGSKFGVRVRPEGGTYIDNDPAWIREAVEGSLTRLGVEAIDVYQLHWWDGKTPFADIFGTLENLRNAGKIKAWGATNITASQIAKAFPDGPPAAFATYSCEFSLVFQQRRAEIDGICSKGTGPHFLSWGSLGGGVLSGKYRTPDDLDPTDRRLKRPDSHFSGERLERNLKIVAEARTIGEELGLKPAQVALNWVQAGLGFASCLVGVKSEAQLREAVESFDAKLTPEHLRRLNAVSAGPS